MESCIPCNFFGREYHQNGQAIFKGYWGINEKVSLLMSCSLLIVLMDLISLMISLTKV